MTSKLVLGRLVAGRGRVSDWWMTHHAAKLNLTMELGENRVDDTRNIARDRCYHVVRNYNSKTGPDMQYKATKSLKGIIMTEGCDKNPAET